MKRILATLLVGALLGACGDDGPSGPQNEVFTATLNGASERPNPVTTNATGTFTATFNPTTNSFSYTLTANNITAVTNAHIHGPATTEESAGVIVPLVAPIASASVSGTFGSASITAAGVSLDSLIALMRNGRAYVNVHNSVDTGGHIRGQIQRQ